MYVRVSSQLILSEELTRCLSSQLRCCDQFSSETRVANSASHVNSRTRGRIFSAWLNRTTKVRSAPSRLLSSPETGRREVFSFISPRNNSLREVHATYAASSILHYLYVALAERVTRVFRMARPRDLQPIIHFSPNDNVLRRNFSIEVRNGDRVHLRIGIACISEIAYY